MTILEAAERSLNERWYPCVKEKTCKDMLLKSSCGICPMCGFRDNKEYCPFAIEVDEICDDNHCTATGICIPIWRKFRLNVSGILQKRHFIAARKAALEIVSLLETIRDRELAKLEVEK